MNSSGNQLSPEKKGKLGRESHAVPCHTAKGPQASKGHLASHKTQALTQQCGQVPMEKSEDGCRLWSGAEPVREDVGQ